MPTVQRRSRTTIRLTASLLAMGLSITVGCRRDSTLDDIPPAPGDPYANATTPPERMPEAGSSGEADEGSKLATPPPRADAPPPQDTARPKAGPDPRQPTAAAPRKPAPDPASPEPAPTTGAAAATSPPPQKAAPPAKKEPDVAANRSMVSDFGLCRAKCDSDPDLDPENAPTCKLACINDTAPKDTYAMGCKRDCMRDASRCYDPCEASGSASCRQGCERTLLSCMNDCDTAPPS